MAVLPLGLLVPGLRELILVAIVALTLYGRGGSNLLRATRFGRSWQPWLRLIQVPAAARARSRSRPRPTARPVARPRSWSWPRRRSTWLLLMIAGVAVAAWIATRVTIHQGAHIVP